MYRLDISMNERDETISHCTGNQDTDATESIRNRAATTICDNVLSESGFFPIQSRRTWWEKELLSEFWVQHNGSWSL